MACICGQLALPKPILFQTLRSGAWPNVSDSASSKQDFPACGSSGRSNWGEIIDILSRLPGAKPSISSIYRLEQGDAIRMSSARRVFDVINGAMEHKLDASKELEASW